MVKVRSKGTRKNPKQTQPIHLCNGIYAITEVGLWERGSTPNTEKGCELTFNVDPKDFEPKIYDGTI